MQRRALTMIVFTGYSFINAGKRPNVDIRRYNSELCRFCCLFAVIDENRPFLNSTHGLYFGHYTDQTVLQNNQ